MNDCHKRRKVNLIRRSLGGWRWKREHIKSREQIWSSERYFSQGCQQKREKRPSLMTALPIPVGVTGTLTSTCYSSYVRYQINLFQRILWDNHDFLATGILVKAFNQIKIEGLVWFVFSKRHTVDPFNKVYWGCNYFVEQEDMEVCSHAIIINIQGLKFYL